MKSARLLIHKSEKTVNEVSDFLTLLQLGMNLINGLGTKYRGALSGIAGSLMPTEWLQQDH